MKTIEANKCTIHIGDCVEAMAALPADSIDSIVTDPPYGLSFMNKSWDKGVPGVEVWRECLRVLKPGGHLLAFAGTRTQHRMATAIEDAGFQIRDMIAWVYGSGFPKSLDVSKAIDAQDAVAARRERALKFTAWMREACPLSVAQCNQIIKTEAEAGHYFTAGEQPHIATAEHFDRLRPYFTAKVPDEIEEMVKQRTIESQTLKSREVIGHKTGQQHADGRKSCFDVAAKMVKVDLHITAPATDAAKQWSGWGTALKPATEMITVARKPLCGTVAENVLQHGTGGLNVDGCRVGTEPPAPRNAPKKIMRGGKFHAAADTETEMSHYNPTQGRWPANLIHDGSDEVVGLFPETAPAKMADRGKGIDGPTFRHASGEESGIRGHDDSGGSAARFFYCPKADPSERRNSKHPTIKPLALMRYLTRLVTPPGGLVLDPFAGSGTTLEAARLEGFRAMGCELDEGNLPDILERLAQGVLF